MNKFNRDSDGFIRSERVSWLDEFAESIEKASKTAVEVARNRDQASIQDQIQSILGGGGKTSVSQKVIELQERTGLRSFIDKVYASDKTAQVKLFPNLSQDLEEKIKVFIDNIVKTHHGFIAISAVQEEILSHFSGEGVTSQDVNTNSVSDYINQVITNHRSMSSHTNDVSNQLGKNLGITDSDGKDPENSDFMHGLLPKSD